MRYLLDTHIAMWFLNGSKKPLKEAFDIIVDSRNQIYYSTLSSWEIEIKRLKTESFTFSGKMYSFLCDNSNFINLPLTNKDIEMLEDVEKENENHIHNDPFGKMLLAQAMAQDMVLITHDQKFKQYKNNHVMVI